MTLTLSYAEMWQAASVGIMRQIGNLKRNRKPRHGCRADDVWNIHIEGACAEFAVAKVMGHFWSGAIDDLGADDAGPLQVRHTPLVEGRLIIHPTDRDDRAYVLVRGAAPCMEIAGWIMGADAKRQEWWDDPTGGRPAFFVPASALHSMVELRK